ncbi:septum formation protein Maf [Candidatus Roizmanbacteria bacterium RIFCSPLOWO2_12_FULL_40_12]|uniref:dTTP/UTP pyrophosphatase n=1 Tax=Candidatus Roizmanbacteria bacterium RIFCSPLOWO2_01_FULL_40_42 TaxID=1802066 RepID=A0A1F7J3H3_9BACT|nr:MAG: septum formation protein Maf [Candidatus Roizmanbacteria bacterium RIFCSPHIGHO2_01_FULL_40_98]OGK28927.1 MAG: septum formation protein Maf [Candidatus Roizmanbacteria bacterium RIFCSPHIGHO2_02_FULL_40_53]OGK29607.1 MAG: septum formation protein Maf [Candidatus Roizmanbacteria bacterium RIFCSPHIGHO2_12_41_18]OGK36688.1 MAG: septum formation protein Maf [Candidatus Roizmanbacteria bacterium RIFCSPHIGHO2_12_FULL_40_130]OGK50156.1 MAG: septum formation protein Maf [Candidatus Roizmanbacteri
MKRLILASKSPRRKKLLQQLGLKFKVVDSGLEEKINPKLSPSQLAMKLSQEKARVVAKRYKNSIIIAADTFITLGKTIIGKPKDKKDAKRILKILSGRMHPIITGFTVMDSNTGKSSSKFVVSKVWIKKLAEKEINEYVATGEPMDKAGAYGIQERGSVFVKKIDGDYFNVVGLPLRTLTEELKKFGVKIL